MDRLSIPSSRSSTNTGGGKGKAKVANVKENMIINGSSNRKAKFILNSSNAMVRIDDVTFQMLYLAFLTLTDFLKVAASNNARKERHKTSKKSATKKVRTNKKFDLFTVRFLSIFSLNFVCAGNNL